MDQLLKATDGENKPTIRDYWRGYNILNAINNNGKTWEEVSESWRNGVWRKFWPDCVNNFTGFMYFVPTLNRDILSLATQAGFHELDSENIEQVLASHTEELTNEDLQPLTEQSATEDADDGKEPQRTLRPRSHLPRRPWGLQNLRPLAILRRPQYFHGHTM